MNSKPFFQSKTIIGAVMMAVSLGLQLCHVPASTDEISQAGIDLTSAVQGIAGLIGFVMVIIGRIKAKDPISLSGNS